MPTPDTYLTGRHYGLAGINHAALRNCIGNKCFSVHALALEAGDKNDIQTTSAVLYSINGVNFTKSTISDLNQTVTDFYGDTATQAAATKCWYVYTLNAGGDVNVYKGADDETGDLPGHPEDECAFGLLSIITTTVEFTMGTEDYDTASFTEVFYDLTCLPPAPPATL